jgi:hypothetical protein
MEFIMHLIKVEFFKERINVRKFGRREKNVFLNVDYYMKTLAVE